VNHRVLGITHTVCKQCGELIPARVEARNDEVLFRSMCEAHGESEATVWRGIDSYLTTQHYVKPAWRPADLGGDSSMPCPQGCGFCDRHEQHLCLPIVEITGRCNLACPICLVDAGSGDEMSVRDFSRILDVLIRAERQIDVLNLSGGEPLFHPNLLELVDEALSRPEIVCVSISTNGLLLETDDRLVGALSDRGIVISLQFDGFDGGVYRALRGADLLEQKLRVLELLEAADITTTLIMTLAGGVNDDHLDRMVDLLFERDHVVSLMLQPIAFAGRAQKHQELFGRLTIPDVISLLDSTAHDAVAASDFVPLPCSHPLCFSLAFFLMTAGGGPISLARLTRAEVMLDALANRGIAGLEAEEYERFKAIIYELWSGPAASVPEAPAVLETLRSLLRELGPCESCFDPRATFRIAERKVKSIFVHAFQDASTFDLARARRCCNAYPQIDGSLRPACVHNVRQRNFQS
jgi:uncharacterized radical SAM superfamily Fe-S cluster-containing enzyme